MTHTLKFATVVPAAKGIGESDFVAARRGIEKKYGVAPDEVFLDTVLTDGPVTAGDITLDLGELKLRYLGFGADQPRSARDVPADAEPAAEPAPEPYTGSTTTTTV